MNDADGVIIVHWSNKIRRLILLIVQNSRLCNDQFLFGVTGDVNGQVISQRGCGDEVL